LSAVKTIEQIEFLELFEMSGLSAAEVSRRLNISRGAVSMILKGTNSPSGSTLQLMRELVGPDKVFRAELREAAPRSDLEVWRQRAQAAEQELANLKQGLRDLLLSSEIIYGKKDQLNSPTDDAGKRMVRRGVAEVLKTSPK
jgi:transcriptional regulator with XRE-family HTH domain